MSFQQHFKGFWSSILTFQYFGIFDELLFLDVRLKTKTWKSRKIFIFWVIKVKCMWICFFDHHFNFLRVKNDINKNRLNLINLEASEALKGQILATWSAMRLNHFEFDVIWTVLQLFWSYILILQYYGVFVEFP